MQRVRVGFLSLLFLGFLVPGMSLTNIIPPQAFALMEGRTYDQAHNAGYIDWSGPVQYVYMTHRDNSALPPEEGGISCSSGCSEWVTHIGNGGTVSGSFDRAVSYFEVMVASSHDANVGTATLQACSAVRTRNMYDGPGAGLPGFMSLIVTVPAGCGSWSLSASGGYVDFRATEVIYSGPPPTPTSTWIALPSFTPTITNTVTLTPTATSTLTPTNTPTATSTPTQTPTNTPSSTPTPLPPEIVGQIVCDLWGEAGWCRGNESLELAASDPQGFDVTINGDLNGAPFSCGSSCSVPLPEGVGTANYVVTSTSGRSAGGSSTWQRDSTPPTLNIVVPSIDGRNGWYVSEIELTVDASDSISGLFSVVGSIDNGVTWNSYPIHRADGVYPVAAYARDIAGNEVIENKVIQIDTVPPVSRFTSHTNGQVVQGNITLRGRLEDQTSGAASGELSLDDGITWQVVSIDAGNTWSFAWDTGEIPNGQYQLNIRGIDQAGNVGEAASIVLVVDNRPPQVSLTDRWWIWESGELKISPNYFPIARLKVIISDPQYRWPEVVLNFDPEKIPGSISWDRHFADGTLAPSGWFRVIAVACDVHDLCGSDEGIIDIPFVTISTPSLTPSPTPTSMIIPSVTLVPTQKLAVPTSTLVVPSPEISPESAQPTRALPFWQLVGLLGLFLAITSASVIDPRPRAIDRLRESMNLILGQKKDISINQTKEDQNKWK